MFIELTLMEDAKTIWISVDHILTIRKGPNEDSIVHMETGQSFHVSEAVKDIIVLIDERVADH